MTNIVDEEVLPEAAFSLTCRSGKGYDADMLTVRGQTYDEFRDNGIAVLGIEILDGKLDQLRQVPQDATGSAPAAQSKPAASAPQNATQAPAGSGDWKTQAPSCEHGQRQPVEFTPKSGPNAGKPQYAYFCPQPREVPRDQKCTPIDAISGKSWG